jgi:NTP pyrophosphatase (non-canonical NTP hydrolase)
MLAPCKNLIPDQIGIDELCEMYRDIGGEYAEVAEAWNELTTDIDDGKKRQHLAEEVVDLMTVCATFLKAMEGLDGVPQNFVDTVFKMVYCKNAARGYFDIDEKIKIVNNIDTLNA